MNLIQIQLTSTSKHFICTHPLGPPMTGTPGQETIDRLGSKDLNEDGVIINLAIVGSSRFYDFNTFEEAMDQWTRLHGYPDMIILGGASGVDYMAERWADNSGIPSAVFTEEWQDPTRTLRDRGRPEAGNSLTRKIMSSCSHILAMPSPTSKWTRIVIDLAKSSGKPIHVLEVE